jgi:DnaJ-domain-containing protein 1
MFDFGGIEMFVKDLSKDDREHLLNLIYLVAKVDGDYADEENEVLERYRREMKLESLKIISDNVTDMILYFADKDTRIKKIVLFEVCSMVLADEQFVNREKVLVDTIRSSFGFTLAQANELFSLVLEQKKLNEKILQVMNS